MIIDFQEAPSIPSWLEAVYPFQRRIAVIRGVRVHFVDEGAGPPVVMLHGNPTWSFLWRKVIPLVVAQGCRVIAPDLVGLGLSDKPLVTTDHFLTMHVDTILRLLNGLELENITMVGQDWGGPIAGGVAARIPQRVSAAVFGNTAILEPKRPIKTTTFHRFSHLPVISNLVFRGLNFPACVMERVQGDRHSIGPLEKRAYAYPLNSWRKRTAPLALARMVPNTDDHLSLNELRASDRWARSFKGPVALVWGLKDPILGRALRRMHEAFPQAHVTETQAGHFLQEEVPQELADAIMGVVREAKLL